MICKTCGYEAQKNFYICPSCGGEDIVTQNVDIEANQRKYYQNSNPSQYQTPFTSPNPNNQNEQSGQFNNTYSNNQNEQSIQSNNTYSDPTLNYQNIPESVNEPVYVRPVYNPLEMAHYFEGRGCSFKVTDNEIKISRDLDGGRFTSLPAIIGCIVSILGVVSAFVAISLIPNIGDIINDAFNKCDLVRISLIIFLNLFLLSIPLCVIRLADHATIIVNSSGITVKTLIGQNFIPKENIYYCDIKSEVRLELKSEYRHRYRNRRRRTGIGAYLDSVYRKRNDDFDHYNQVLYQKVVIIAKGKSDKCDEIDIGLSYKSSEPVIYLRDEFNRYLGIDIKGI